jgi:predicted RND superfamily exporter protein
VNNLLDRVKEMSLQSKIISLIVAAIIVVGGFVVINNNQSTNKSSETYHSENQTKKSSNDELSGTYTDSNEKYYVIFKGKNKAELGILGSSLDATYEINKDNTITFTANDVEQDKQKYRLSNDKKSIKVYSNTNGSDALEAIMKKTSKKIDSNKTSSDDSKVSSSSASSTSNQSSDYNPATSNKSPYDNNQTTDRPQDSLKGSADQDVESADQINQNIKNGANAESSTRFATGSDVVGGAFN